MYELVPNTQEVDFYFFTYKSIYYKSIYVLSWALVQKFIIIFLLLVWYITNKNWWRYSLAVPCFMFIYQSIYMIVEDSKPQDEIANNCFFVISITLIVLLVLHLLSEKIRRKVNLINISKLVDNEINEILSNKDN
ncbi:hypothetical protein BWK59_12755 [Flavobacterium davisii]|uniref:Uncharacterized protein n=1 Tax=Flavobacterium davisii TaxID=2906077 RepID=A0A246GFV9_9FLAO|nr:hypothetical protein BWK59_12755 [Flavobacterium davisii]